MSPSEHEMPCPMCDGWGTIDTKTGGDLSNSDAEGGRTCPRCNGSGFKKVDDVQTARVTAGSPTVAKQATGDRF
jgi:DnaJ-class molecular chaperone